MKQSNHNYAVILAGGQGSRFWPLSRSLEPKQFLSLYTRNSLFQDTITRIKSIIPSGNIYIITSQLYTSEMLDFAAAFKIPRANIIFEEQGKNTAPSIAVASRIISLTDPEALMVVMPSDHLIRNQKRFKDLLRIAFSLKELENNLCIFGIHPDSPATGYGYVKISNQPLPWRGAAKAAKPVARNQKLATKTQQVYKVEKFIEKPDVKTAKSIFKNKRYFWNSGIFLGYADVFQQQIRKYLPLLYQSVSQIYEPEDIKKVWKDIKPISFDYGVLEKTKNLLMVPALNLSWSDLGAWSSLDKILPKDKCSNTIRADAVVSDSKNITVFGKNRLIACLGLENLIVVDTPDALLVTRKDKSEEVKKVVDILHRNKRRECYLHPTVKRPWGKYTVLDRGRGFRIKLVEVSPGKSLTLQKHMHRSEHWVVLQGEAKITKGKKSFYVKANESTFIPLGCAHRLKNPTESPLKIVEVQSGDNLEEGDIIRVDDGS